MQSKTMLAIIRYLIPNKIIKLDSADISAGPESKNFSQTWEKLSKYKRNTII